MEMEVDVESQRHPFRFMVKFLVFVGILYVAGRFLAQQKDEWMGLTESEAKAKVESKLSSRVGEDKASEIANQVVAVLTEKGVIKSDTEAAVNDLKAEAEDVVVKSADEAAEEEAE